MSAKTAEASAFDGSPRAAQAPSNVSSHLIEHYVAAAFPLWLRPCKWTICPVSEKVADYAKHVTET